ncbi:HNH endonuclease [Clostridium bornimense]|uniref:transglutaminase domain-containing protein n=1 Tax=Clostridium bornimense TaxID=1216932 RepID=UPI001C116281|nr:HNH endonuclease [Clostridium bornimense]MBU5316217.1 HNH endonuclease [Clostridium bornimense]
MKDKWKVTFKSIALTLIVIMTINCSSPSEVWREIKNSSKKLWGDKETLTTVERTKLGSLQETVSDNKEKSKDAIENDNLDESKKFLEETLEAIESNEDKINKEFKDIEKYLDKNNLDVAKSRLTEVKNQFKDLVNSKDKIEEAINSDDKDKILAVLDDESIFGKDENTYKSLGDDALPHNNEEAEYGTEEATAISNDPIEYSLDKATEDNEEYLKETLDTKITEVIKKKSDELSNNPLDIYKFVRNNVNFEAYAGSRKGATGALEQLAGNDYDQSSLLIALLRSKNIPAKYVTGTVDVSVENAMAWTGAETPKVAADMLAAMGNKTTAITSGGEIVKIRIDHVWVEAYCSLCEYRGQGEVTDEKEWIPFDPSFKKYKKVEGTISSVEKDIETSDIADDFYYGGVKTEDTFGVKNIYNDDLKYVADDIKSQLEKYINEETLEGKRLIDVVGGLEIIPEEIDLLPFSIPNTLVSIDSRSSEIDNNKREKVSIEVSDTYGIGGELSLNKTAVELYGKKLTLSWIPATDSDEEIISNYGSVFDTPAYLVEVKPVIKADGEVIAEGSAIGLGQVENFSILLDRVGLSSQRVTAVLTAGGYYALGLDYGAISENEITNIQSRMKEAEENADEKDYYSDDVAGEILNGIIKSYFGELDSMNRISAEMSGVKDTRSLSFGISGFKPTVKYLYGTPVDLKLGSVYVDIGGDAHSVVSRDGDKEKEKTYMIKTGMIASAMESSIIEQMCGLPAVSTVSILNKAAEEGETLYSVTKENINEVLPLLNVSEYVKNEIVNEVNSGKEVTIPKNEISYYDWTGSVYIVMDNDTGAAGYMIAGGHAGGEGAIDFSTVNWIEVIGHFFLGWLEGAVFAIPFIVISLLVPFASAMIALVAQTILALISIYMLIDCAIILVELNIWLAEGRINSQTYCNAIAEIVGMFFGGRWMTGKAPQSKLYNKIRGQVIESKAKELGLEVETVEKLYQRNGTYELDEGLKAAKKAKEAGMTELELREASESLSAKGFRNYCETISKFYKDGKINSELPETLKKFVFEQSKNDSEIPDTIFDKAQKVENKIIEIKTSIKEAKQELFQSIKLKIYDLGESLGCTFEETQFALADGEMLIIKKSEINGVTDFEYYATKIGSEISIKDVFGESIAKDVASGKLKIKESGTVIRIKDGSKLIKARVVPKGYLSSEQFIKQIELGRVDIEQWGYSSVESVKEVIELTDSYLSKSSGARDNTLKNSKNAGNKIKVKDANNIEYEIEIDPIGYPVFKGEYVKVDINIKGDAVVKEKGLSNMKSREHMKAATREFRRIKTEEAEKLGKSIEEHLKDEGFNEKQIDDIKGGKDEIEGYTWHHHQESGRMQLVEGKIHASLKHNGGNCLWGEESKEN